MLLGKAILSTVSLRTQDGELQLTGDLVAKIAPAAEE